MERVDSYEIDESKLQKSGPPKIESWPEGFVSEFIDWAKEGTDANYEFLLCSALSALTTACSHSQLYLEFGSQRIYTGIWLLLIAPSSLYRKTTALSLAKSCIMESCPDLVMADRLTPESFYEGLAIKPHGCFYLNEFGAWLRSFNKSYMSGFQQDLTELYDSPAHFRRNRKNQRGNVLEFVIERPIINLFGASTIDWLVESLKESDAGSGFLPRFLFCSVTERTRPIQIIPRRIEEKPPGITFKLKRMAKESRGTVRIKENSKAYRVYADFFNDILAELESSSLNKAVFGGFAIRLQTYALKFALAFEAERRIQHGLTLVEDIDAESMRGAVQITRWFYEQAKYLLQSQLVFSECERKKQKVTEILIKNNGFAKRSVILRRSKMLSRELDEIVKTMVEAGELYERNSLTGGRPCTEFYLVSALKD